MFMYIAHVASMLSSQSSLGSRLSFFGTLYVLIAYLLVTDLRNLLACVTTYDLAEKFPYRNSLSPETAYVEHFVVILSGTGDLPPSSFLLRRNKRSGLLSSWLLRYSIVVSSAPVLTVVDISQALQELVKTGLTKTTCFGTLILNVYLSLIPCALAFILTNSFQNSSTAVALVFPGNGSASLSGSVTQAATSLNFTSRQAFNPTSDVTTPSKFATLLAVSSLSVSENGLVTSNDSLQATAASSHFLWWTGSFRCLKKRERV